MKKIALLTAFSMLSAIQPIKATVLVDWTFETSQPTTAGAISPEIGSGNAYGSHAGAAVYSSPAGNGSSHSYSSTVWAVNDYWEFDFSSLGYTGVQISFDQTSSNTGPGHFGLFYSINSGPYTQIGANYTVLANASPNPPWNATTSSSLYTLTPNLSSLGSALDNETSVSFRLVDQDTVSANGGTVSSGGTDRVDNFIVTVNPVPEPTTLALSALGGLACLLSMQRKRRQ